MCVQLQRAAGTKPRRAPEPPCLFQVLHDLVARLERRIGVNYVQCEENAGTSPFRAKRKRRRSSNPDPSSTQLGPSRSHVH